MSEYTLSVCGNTFSVCGGVDAFLYLCVWERFSVCGNAFSVCGNAFLSAGMHVRVCLLCVWERYVCV